MPGSFKSAQFFSCAIVFTILSIRLPVNWAYFMQPRPSLLFSHSLMYSQFYYFRQLSITELIWIYTAWLRYTSKNREVPPLWCNTEKYIWISMSMTKSQSVNKLKFLSWSEAFVVLCSQIEHHTKLFNRQLANCILLNSIKKKNKHVGV